MWFQRMVAALNKQFPGDHRGADPNWSPDGKSLLFGRFPADESPEAGTLNLEILDLRTHAISKVPGSEGALVTALVARWQSNPRVYDRQRPSDAVRF
jgi:hypothetical protein